MNYLTLQPAGSACAERFSSCIHFCLAESVSLLLPTEHSVQWKRIDGGIRQFDKVDLVSQAYFQAAPSQGARSSSVSLRSTCVQGCEGRLMLVLHERVSVCTVNNISE